MRIKTKKYKKEEVSDTAASVVPEPASLTLFKAGGATLGFRRFRKKFKK